MYIFVWCLYMFFFILKLELNQKLECLSSYKVEGLVIQYNGGIEGEFLDLVIGYLFFLRKGFNVFIIVIGYEIILIIKQFGFFIDGEKKFFILIYVDISLFC